VDGASTPCQADHQATQHPSQSQWLDWV